MPAKMKTIDGVKNVSIVIGVKFVVVASEEFAESEKKKKILQNICSIDLTWRRTYDTVEYHTIANELIRSLCNTMDSVPLRQHFCSNFRHFALVETHSAVVCVSAASVNPISGMEFQFWSYSLAQCSSDHFPFDSRLK